MKVKASITISDDLLHEIDRRRASFRSRSQFLETADRGLLDELTRQEMEREDLAIISRRADVLNAEAQDVLAFQVPL